MCDGDHVLDTVYSVFTPAETDNSTSEETIVSHNTSVSNNETSTSQNKELISTTPPPILFRHMGAELSIVLTFPIGCGFRDMSIVREKRYGLRSCFIFKCKMCNVELPVNTEKDNQEMGVNSVRYNVYWRRTCTT
ncbi:hypothetical protein PR048_018157 [Dryococelus australis]|uniref:Mutator-like transposase domain-containing protein n=1 Tax=Dryococelus australis TaxID=614101 RepID=A0ABQ9HBH7_9NEOP|nr:hypothetical protein PR048_018157 [Dryococelus australis]